MSPSNDEKDDKPTLPHRVGEGEKDSLHEKTDEENIVPPKHVKDILEKQKQQGTGPEIYLNRDGSYSSRGNK